MTTHACPTCQYQHEPPTFMAAVTALTEVARAAESVGAKILVARPVPGHVSVGVETEEGLRALASLLRFPAPAKDSFKETQAVFAGVLVTLHCWLDGGGGVGWLDGGGGGAGGWVTQNSGV